MDIDGAGSALRFAVLGPLRSWRGEQALDLGPSKQRAVLAVLLLDANRAIPAQRIVEAVWDDDPPENGANVVQKYVAGLRRVLEPERSPRAPSQVLTLSDGGYRLHVSDFDLQVFQTRVRRAETLRRGSERDEASAELRSAVDLWRGQPLAGLSGRWFDARRQQLADQYAAAWEALAELELELGRHTGLTTELSRLVADHPGREGLRAALMLALYRSGRQAASLAAYRDAQQHLREEFGIDPGGPLQDLHRRILRSDPTLQSPPASGPVSPSVPLSRSGPESLPVERPTTPATTPGPAALAPAASAVQYEFPALSYGHYAPYEPYAPTGPPPMPGPTSRAGPTRHVGSLDPADATGPVSPPMAAAMPPPMMPPLYLGPLSPGRPPPHISWVALTKASVGAAAALFTCGLGTWAVVGFLAYRRRSVVDAVAAFVYCVLSVSFLVAALIYPDEAGATDDMTRWDWFVLPGLLIPSLLGSTHAFALILLAPERYPSHHLGPATNDANDRLERERALQIITHHPQMALELRIGRPDLPRWFGDGGLIDVNAVPEYVLVRVPGVTYEQVGRILSDRFTNGPFRSVGDLVTRHPDLRFNNTALLRLVVIDLPGSRQV